MENLTQNCSNPQPLVSISCITYNHENFIRDAIEGFLMQQTSFPIEILVHDDASTDRTAEIIREYEALHPDLIIPIYQTENQYSKGNRPGLINRKRARGKYIAICEGDDYWTDPLKLQKQVDFLEANPDYVICYHDAIIIDEHGNLISDSKLSVKMKRDFSNIELITQMPFILTLSVCFRNVLKEIPNEMSKVLNGDTFLFSLLGSYGKGKYLADIHPAVYRRHSGGIWSMITEREKSISLITTSFWLAQYYLRIERNDYAHSFFEHIRYRINNMDSYDNKPQQLKSEEKPVRFMIRLSNLAFIAFNKFFHLFPTNRKAK